MRRPIHRTACPLILLLLALPLRAVDDRLPDTTASLHPTDNVVALAKLRTALVAQPDDQHLLGLALMAYVNLCFSGEKDDEGADGPWLTYATALLERRVKARGGMPAADFTQAEPELWVRLLSGYRQEVADALARWPQDQDRPGHRALRVLATGDWRTFTAKPPVTLHERYATLRIGFETGASSLTSHLSMQESRHHPLLAAKITWRQGYWGRPEIIIGETVSFSAWMLASQELDDATASELLREFAVALGIAVVPDEERMVLWKRVIAVSRDQEPLNAAALGVAMRVCERLLDQDAGMVAADGRVRLYGLGDLAAWNRDRCYLAAFYGYLIARSGHQDYTRADREYVAVLRQALPRSVIAMRYSLGHQGMNFAPDDKPAAEHWDGLAEAIAAEIARPRGHSGGTLATVLSKLAIGRPERAAELVRALVARDGMPSRRVIETLVQAAGVAGEVPLLLPTLRQWSAAAPMDLELANLCREWSPETTLFAPVGKPHRTWTDAMIDNRQLPWPRLDLRQHFGIRWRGMLRIDKPGSYVLASESDDGSRLAVGDAVVDNSGDHAMRVRRVRVTLEPGWLRLRLDYLQGTGDAGCRLLWQPPGAGALVPIPATHLAQAPDGPAGLIAEGFDLRNERRLGPTGDQVAFASARPWHLRAQDEVGQALFDAGRYGEAVPFFRAMLVDPQRQHSGQRLAQCLLWQDPPDVDGALAAMRRHPDLWRRGWELVRTLERIRRAGRLQEMVDAIGKQNHDDDLWPLVRGYAALERGEFLVARDEFARLMGERGPGDRFLPNGPLNLTRLEWAVLSRLDGKEPDWGEIEAGLRRNRAEPYHDLTFDWLSGAVSWEESAARAPMVTDGDDLFYFQGLVALTTGDHALAKRRFQEMVDKHPDWMEATTSRALLRWYEQQTPESLAKIATAKPLGKPAVQPGKPRPDANDF